MVENGLEKDRFLDFINKGGFLKKAPLNPQKLLWLKK